MPNERLWTPGGPQDFAHVDPEQPPNRAEKRRMHRELKAFKRRAAKVRDAHAKARKVPTPSGSIAAWIRDKKAYRWLD